jgi:hypothetical protein
MIREYNRMKLINNILYRITTIEDEERQQLVLPAVKKLLWVLTVLSDWLEFFVEDIFHIAQSRTLYLCTFLASIIGHVAKIEFCLFLDVPYHHVGLVTLLVCVQQV